MKQDKTCDHETLRFIDSAERHLQTHPLEPQRNRLERFLVRLRQGDHVLREPLTLDEFFQGLSHRQYEATLDTVGTLPLHDPRRPELVRRILHYQATSRRYQVVCKTPCYVGQGLCFEYGHVLATYYTLAEAEQHLDAVNHDPWCRDCWELHELEPTQAPNPYEGEEEGEP